MARFRSERTHQASIIIRSLLDRGLNTGEIAACLGLPVGQGGLGYRTTGARVRQICTAYGIQVGQSGRRRFAFWMSRKRSRILIEAAAREGVSPAVMLERCVACVLDDGLEKAIEATRGHVKFVKSRGGRL